MVSPVNQSALLTRRSRENLKPNAAASASRAQHQPQPGNDFTLQRKSSLNQLDSSTPVGISINSSAGALAGYYNSGAAPNHKSSDSLDKEAATASLTGGHSQPLANQIVNDTS